MKLKKVKRPPFHFHALLPSDLTLLILKSDLCDYDNIYSIYSHGSRNPKRGLSGGGAASHLGGRGLHAGTVLAALVVDEAQLAEEHGERAQVLLQLAQPVLVGVGVVRHAVGQLGGSKGQKVRGQEKRLVV